jgi:hypothetical protein
MFSYFTDIFETIVTEFSLGTSASFALGLATFLIGMLALREIASWFLKTNHIQAEILSLRDQIANLEASLEQFEAQAPVEEEEKTKDSVLPEPLFETEIKETSKEQFPLQ